MVDFKYAILSSGHLSMLTEAGLQGVQGDNCGGFLPLTQLNNDRMRSCGRSPGDTVYASMVLCLECLFEVPSGHN